MKKYFAVLSLLSLVSLAGCGAQDDSAGESGKTSDTATNSMKKIGAYGLPTGGALDVYEASAGEFIIAERIPAGKEAANDKADSFRDSESLPAIYKHMTGSSDVPVELVQAEERRLAFEAKFDPAAMSTRAPSVEVRSEVPAVDVVKQDGVQLKEAPRDVAGFRLVHCRETDSVKKTFTYCLTEKTNDTDQTKNDIHGSYTAVRPYRGSITYTVRYNLTGWENAFIVTVNEGETYRARKVGPVRDYDINARVNNAAGDGWNLAVFGTDNFGDKGCYGDFTCAGCVCISGT
jgi:hypothetical protein